MTKPWTFNAVLISNIQIFVGNCNGFRTDDCALNTNPDVQPTLNQILQNVQQCMKSLGNTLSNVRAVFYLCDLVDSSATTWNGLGMNNTWRRNRMENVYSRLSNLTLRPIVVQLGNHDYQVAQDDNAVRNVNYLTSHIKQLLRRSAVRLRSFDIQSTPTLNAFSGLTVKFTTGSLAYSFKINGFVFIMLNWAYADYTVSNPIGYLQAVNCATVNPLVNTINGQDNDNYVNVHQVNITNATAWMIREVKAATAERKKIVLITHGAGGLKTFVKNNPDVSNELVKYNIVALFSGHTHNAWGYDSDWEIKSTKSNMTLNVPTYYMGSSLYQKMSSARFAYYGSDVIQFTVYNTTDAGRCGTNPISEEDWSTTSDTAPGADQTTVGPGFNCV